MPKRKRSYFLYIIESPSDEDFFDKRTEGGLLLEALRLSQVSNQPQAPVEYRLVVSEQSFDKAMLEDLPRMLIQLKGVIPILHMSMHGNEGGLQLTDRTDIPWKELAKLLSDINRHYANGELIVCVSACKGFYGGMMQFFERRRRPFKALVGPWNQPNWEDAAVAYVTFYHLLMNKGRTVKTSVEAMKMASGNHRFDSTTPKELLTNARRH
ncbi:MAG: hypothetical protein V1850_05610 [Candidatus Bathyarchaeota archaeon]